jgi:DNA ligase-1
VRRFARLFAELDETTKTNAKVAAMVRYFSTADPADAAWAVYFLSGNRPKRLLSARRLADWAMEQAGIPPWLFEESYHAVGDLAETIALLLPPATEPQDLPLHRWLEERILPLAGAAEAVQRDAVLRAWREVDGTQRFLLNKMLTGEFRVGVAHNLVVRAVAQSSGVDEPTIAHRLTGTWLPRRDAYARLVSGDTADADVSQPYPFFLAYPLEDPPETLGDAGAWQVEWKWDGIRAQMIRRRGQSFLWSRGEELVTERFPELAEAAALLPDGTVLDGEILPWQDGRPLGFAQLQRRIGRKKLGPKIFAEVPVVLVAYDLLEHGGVDVRDKPLAWRRERLAQLIEGCARRDTRGVTPVDALALDDVMRPGNAPPGARPASRLILSPAVPATDWEAVRGAYGRAREECAEGLMLKRREAAYGVGRRRGPWWKWKVEPYSVDAVLIYAQPGHGRRASLHTDYTFAVWDGEQLVPFAKAYTGLTDAEIRQLDAWIRRNTVEKFGPVRSVKPEQVFELGFEGIQASPRHKSGVAVRFPRMLRWRTDKRPEDADTLATLRSLMDAPR